MASRTQRARLKVQEPRSTAVWPVCQKDSDEVRFPIIPSASGQADRQNRQQQSQQTMSVEERDQIIQLSYNLTKEEWLPFIRTTVGETMEVTPSWPFL